MVRRVSLRDREAPERPRDDSRGIAEEKRERRLEEAQRVKADRGEFVPREAARAARGEARRARDLEEPRRDEEGRAEASAEKSEEAAPRAPRAGPRSARARARRSARAASAGSPPRTRSAEERSARPPARRRPGRPSAVRARATAKRSHGIQAIVVVAFRNAAEDRTKPERPNANAPVSAASGERTSVPRKRNAPSRPSPRWRRRWRPRKRGLAGKGYARRRFGLPRYACPKDA